MAAAVKQAADFVTEEGDFFRLLFTKVHDWAWTCCCWPACHGGPI